MPDYHGGCHCGSVRITVRRDSPIDSLTDCNCTVCRKKGILHLPVQDDDLTVVQGKDNLTLYQWRTNTASHWFCKACGIHVFGRPRMHPERYTVNARCLDDFDAFMPNVSLVPFDGQNHPKDRQG